MHGDFCLAFTASAKWRVELRAKIGHYRNRCLQTLYSIETKYKSTAAFSLYLNPYFFILYMQVYSEIQKDDGPPGFMEYNILNKQYGSMNMVKTQGLQGTIPLHCCTSHW